MRVALKRIFLIGNVNEKVQFGRDYFFIVACLKSLILIPLFVISHAPADTTQIKIIKSTLFLIILHYVAHIIPQSCKEGEESKKSFKTFFILFFRTKRCQFFQHFKVERKKVIIKLGEEENFFLYFHKLKLCCVLCWNNLFLPRKHDAMNIDRHEERKNFFNWKIFCKIRAVYPAAQN